MWYFSALARSQRIAALQSSTCAGNGASPESRYSTLAETYPSIARKPAGLPSLVPACQAPPWTQTTSGSFPSAFSGTYRSSFSSRSPLIFA